MTRRNTQHIKAMGSSARCGTSLSIGPTSTGAKATHGTSPDIRLHRTDSLACSHTRLLRTSPENRLPRRTHSSTVLPDHLASPNRLPRRTHSPAASPDFCATPDNQLPRTDSLAGSFTGSTCASSPIEYPGPKTPVAGRQRHIAPDHLANAAWIQHDARNTTTQLRNATAHRS